MKGLEKVVQSLPVLIKPRQDTEPGRASQHGGRKTHKQRVVKKLLKVASWNVRNPIDRELNTEPDSSRPRWRTALVAAELGRYNVDIAALSETLLLETVSLTEEGEQYIFSGVDVTVVNHACWEWGVQSQVIYQSALPKLL